MTRVNYLRTEFRYQALADIETFFELVRRIDSTKTKTVLGLDGQFSLGTYPVSFFTHFSYISEDFGLRAELTEDFLAYGRGISVDVSGKISDTAFGWFARYDRVDSNDRFLVGAKWSL